MVLNKKCVAAFCADNGVVAQGRDRQTEEVTAIVAKKFLFRSDQCLCNGAGCRRGCDSGRYRCGKGCLGKGTSHPQNRLWNQDIAKGPAMTREQAADAILYGMQLVKDLKEEGYRLIATGEMGIGNTTTSSAILSVLLDRPVVEMTGRGSRAFSEGLKRKISAIETAIQINQPDPQDALDVLHKVGGLDIAGLVGVFLGGARENIPIVIDGVISAAAAMTAKSSVRPLRTTGLQPMFPRNLPENRSGRFKKRPMLTCDMCLGEGTVQLLHFRFWTLQTQFTAK